MEEVRKYLQNFEASGLYQARIIADNIEYSFINKKLKKKIITEKATNKVIEQVPSTKKFEVISPYLEKKGSKRLFAIIAGISVIVLIAVFVVSQLNNNTAKEIDPSRDQRVATNQEQTVEKNNKVESKIKEVASNIAEKEIPSIKLPEKQASKEAITVEISEKKPEQEKIEKIEKKEKSKAEDKAAEIKKRVEIKRKRGADFNRYFDSAKSLYESGNYKNALSQLKQAKKIKSSRALLDLENRINSAEKKRQDVIAAQVVKKEQEAEIKQPTADLKPVSYFYLAKDLKKKYLSQISRVFIKNLPVDVKIRGQVSVVISVNKNGLPSVKGLNSTGLKITPAMNKAYIENIIRAKFTRMTFPPPKDKAGNPIILASWQIAYSAAYFKNVLSLSMVY